MWTDTERVNELMGEHMKDTPLYLYSFTVTDVSNVVDLSGGPILRGFQSVTVPPELVTMA